MFVYPIWFGMPPAMMKGYVDRVLGAGVTAQEVQDGDSATVLRDRKFVSITSSGASEIWLDAQGQIESLLDLFGRYLVHAFGMESGEYVHLGHVTEGFPTNFLEQHLADVSDHARQICAAVAEDRSQAERTNNLQVNVHGRRVSTLTAA